MSRLLLGMGFDEEGGGSKGFTGGTLDCHSVEDLMGGFLTLL